jgi:hypothetical protein
MSVCSYGVCVFVARCLKSSKLNIPCKQMEHIWCCYWFWSCTGASGAHCPLKGHSQISCPHKCSESTIYKCLGPSTPTKWLEHRIKCGTIVSKFCDLSCEDSNYSGMPYDLPCLQLHPIPFRSRMFSWVVLNETSVCVCSVARNNGCTAVHCKYVSHYRPSSSSYDSKWKDESNQHQDIALSMQWFF